MIELEEEYLKEKYKTLPESAQHDFEDRLLKIGFILDDETSMYGSKREIEKHGYSNIHYQVITKDTYDEEGWNNKLDELQDILDLFEEDYDCSITFNAGLCDDGRITAGIDIRDYWEADEGTDQIAPKKPSKLRFKNGKLADTEENKFVIQDITSHMKGVTKDDIEAAAPVDKRLKESYSNEIGSIVAHIKKVLENNKYLSFEKMIEKGDEVYLTYKATDELIKKARPSMKDVVSDSIYEISITDYIDEIDVEINVQFEFSYESLDSVYIEGNDFTELDEVLDRTLSEKALVDNAENNDTWE